MTAPSTVRSNGTRHNPRPSKAELDSRIEIILGMLVQGFRRSEILQFVAEKRLWAGPDGAHVEDRTVDSYIARAYKALAAAAKPRHEREVGKAIARYELIFRKAIADKDWNAARKAQDSLNRLLGLEKPIKVSTTGTMEHTGTVTHEHRRPATHEQRAATIAELVAVARDRMAAGAAPRARQQPGAGDPRHN